MLKNKKTNLAPNAISDPLSAQNKVDKSTWEKVFPDYPIYPPSEDIYNAGVLLEDINPEDPRKNKTANVPPEELNEKSFEDDMIGNDLDVPGSELDDEREMTGNEDEENNYYSLGGDSHNDLDEDNG